MNLKKLQSEKIITTIRAEKRERKKIWKEMWCGWEYEQEQYDNEGEEE